MMNSAISWQLNKNGIVDIKISIDLCEFTGIVEDKEPMIYESVDLLLDALNEIQEEVNPVIKPQDVRKK